MECLCLDVEWKVNGLKDLVIGESGGFISIFIYVCVVLDTYEMCRV